MLSLSTRPQERTEQWAEAKLSEAAGLAWITLPLKKSTLRLGTFNLLWTTTRGRASKSFVLRRLDTLGNVISIGLCSR